MTALQLASKIESLPIPLKKEAEKYIDTLLEKAKKEIPYKKPVFGCAKGHFKMADDFDAPLDDFIISED